MIDKYPEPPNKVFIHTDNAITVHRCFDSDVEYLRADAIRKEIWRMAEKYKEECSRTSHVWDELFSSIDTIGEGSEPAPVKDSELLNSKEDSLKETLEIRDK